MCNSEGLPLVAHLYQFSSAEDPGAKDLPLTITNRNVEGKPVPGIACNTHICSMQVSFQKYTYPAHICIPDAIAEISSEKASILG
jgi:hypothetical protein